MPVKPAIIPCLRYEDAPAAINFLCRAFGFERHAVYPNAADPTRIDHAQLVREGQMIMLSSVADSDHPRRADDHGGKSRRQYSGALRGPRRC